MQYFTRRTKNFFVYVAAYNSVAKNDGSFKKLSHEETQLSIHLSRIFFPASLAISSYKSLLYCIFPVLIDEMLFGSFYFLQFTY
jgi:hypothetical protein